MNVVIIGNSAAGLSAAETVRRLRPNAKITIISGESLPSYLRCLIYEVLAGLRDLSGIRYRDDDFYIDKGLNVVNGRVMRIQPQSKKLTLEDGRELSYDGLIVATGATPISLDVENSTGISCLHTYHQALSAGTLAEKAKSAVIIGGGLVGLKAAWALSRRKIQVTVVEKATHLLGRQFDQAASRLIEKELTGLGVRFIYNTVPVQFTTGSKGLVESVTLENGQALSADLVIQSLGVRPNTGLVKEAGGITAQGISVNDYLSTSLPDVYAAGDCIEIPDAVTGVKTPSGLWPLAIEQGRYAAYNLIGCQRPYPRPLTNLNAAQIGKLPFVSVGSISGDEEVILDDKSYGVYRKLVFKHDKMVGFIMAGTVDRSGVYTALVKSGQLVTSKLRERLTQGTVTGADLMMSNKWKGV